MRIVLKVLSILSIAAISAGNTPADFPKCRHEDETCLVNGANYVIQKYSTGIPELALISFDPFHIDHLYLATDPKSPVNVTVTLTDIEVRGLKTTEVTVFKGLQDDLKGRTVIEAIIKNLDFKGHYKIDGRVMVLPIGGNGIATFNCNNTKLNYSFALKPIKDSNDYAKLHQVKLDLLLGQCHFEFDNIFNSKELTEAMNSFVNANMPELYVAVKGPVEKEISLIVKNILNKFLAKNSFEGLFLQN